MIIKSKNKKTEINAHLYGDLSLEEFRERFQKGLSVNECEEMYKKCVSEYKKTIKVEKKIKNKEIV